MENSPFKHTEESYRVEVYLYGATNEQNMLNI